MQTDGDNGKRGYDFHAGKVERLTMAPNIALHQKPAGGAAEQIRRGNRDVGKRS